MIWRELCGAAMAFIRLFPLTERPMAAHQSQKRKQGARGHVVEVALRGMSGTTERRVVPEDRLAVASCFAENSNGSFSILEYKSYIC